MKLAVQDRGFFGESFKEKLLKVKEYGFEGMEISGDVLINRYDEIKKATTDTGIPISSICGGYRGWIGAFDKDERQHAIQDIGEILRYAAEIGANGVIAPAAYGMYSTKLPHPKAPRTADEDREVLLDSLEQLNKLAIEAGSKLYLEPLNRYEDHMLNRLEQAQSLIIAGGFTSVQLLADFFHMNIEEADISKSILETKSLVGHVHLADSNRQFPGLGHLDFHAGFQALHQINFSGFLAIECEVTHPEQNYANAVHYLKGIIQKSYGELS